MIGTFTQEINIVQWVIQTQLKTLVRDKSPTKHFKKSRLPESPSSFTNDLHLAPVLTHMIFEQHTEELDFLLTLLKTISDELAWVLNTLCLFLCPAHCPNS